MRRKVILAGSAVAAVALLALPTSASALGGGQEPTARAAQSDDVLYVALGDSVAAGGGASSPSTGYVERLFSHFKDSLGVTQLSNGARPGETSGTLRTGGQLDRAIADINAASDTRVVTLDVGLHERETCVAKWALDGWASCPLRGNLSAILSTLRTTLHADPGTESLVVMAYYNPASGLGGDAPFSGESWYERQLLGSNRAVDCRLEKGPRVGETDIVYQEAGRHSALVANAYPAFERGGQGLMADSALPNDAGHAAIAAVFATATPACVDAAEPDASSGFGIVGVKKNRRRGTATLKVEVPGPGTVELSRTGQVRHAEVADAAAGREKLRIKPRGKATARLEARGSARVKATVVYTPQEGEPTTKVRRVKLIRRGKANTRSRR